MQQGNLNLNWNTSNMFTAYATDGDIFLISGEHIGVSLIKYQEMEKAFQKCRNKLVELGVIVPEKKPEEIIKEQAELLQKQTDMCNSMMAQMQEMAKKLEGVANGCTADKINCTTITDTTTSETESIASYKPSSTDDKSGGELHKGRRSKNTSTT